MEERVCQTAEDTYVNVQWDLLVLTVKLKCQHSVTQTLASLVAPALKQSISQAISVSVLWDSRDKIVVLLWKPLAQICLARTKEPALKQRMIQAINASVLLDLQDKIVPARLTFVTQIPACMKEVVRAHLVGSTAPVNPTSLAQCVKPSFHPQHVIPSLALMEEHVMRRLVNVFA